MSNTTSRGTRSRISSPYVSAPNNLSSGALDAVGDVDEISRAAPGSWQEPALAPPLPSFAEAGIERHGVVANMAPLGTRPTTKIMKQAITKESDPLRRSATIKKFYAQISDTPYSPHKDSTSTPEPGATMTRQGSVSSRGEDGPQGQSSPQNYSSNPRKSLPRATIQDPAQRAWLGVFAVEPVQASPPSNSSVKPTIDADLPSPTLTNEPTPAETDRVVELAVQEAIHAHRWPTAYALRTFFDENNENPRIVRLIEMIFTGRASEAQILEFQAIMKGKKREGSKDNTAHYYFNGDGAETEQTPVPQPPPRQLSTPAASLPVYPLVPVGVVNIFQPVQPKPYKSVYGSTPPSLNIDTSTGITSNSITGLRNSSPGRSSGSGSTAVSPHGTSHMGHFSKKHKGNHHPSMEGQGHTLNKVARAENDALNGLGLSSIAPPGAKSRSSSLSSVPDEVVYLTSDTEDAGPDRSAAHGKYRSGHGRRRKPKRDGRFSSRNELDNALPSAQHKSKLPVLHHFPTAKSASFSQNNKSATPDSTTPASPTRKSKNVSKNKKEVNKFGELAGYDPNDETSRAKRRAKDKTNYSAKIEASYERQSLLVPEDSDDVEIAPAPPPSKRPRVRLFNAKQRSSSRLNQDDAGLSSPSLLSSQLDVPSGSLSVSRAGTPNVQGRPTRRGGRSGSGLRVKSSPMKKKGGGPIAGLPKGGGDRSSPTANGAQNPEDNDDFCSACSGNGTLVCCDGCVRAFHYQCCDPPIDEDNEPDDYWCNLCANLRKLPPPMGEDNGIFGSLLTVLNAKNPSAFSLTKCVREYFSEVRTGPEGEYESGAAKAKARGNEFAKEPTDFFKLGDPKGKAILCFQCREPASPPARAIIPCSYCNLYWHLDCLDPPRAREPAQGTAWRCPAHVDDLAHRVYSMGPAHRRRKIKNAEVIRPLFPRGHKNDGNIEVELEDSDNEQVDFYEHHEYGQTFKLPERAIKLDFLTQVRKKIPGKGFFPPVETHTPPTSTPDSVCRSAAVADFDLRPLEEQQAALNLTQLLARSSQTINDHTQGLINALIAEAPPVVFQSMTQVDATDLGRQMEENQLSGDSKAMLIALRAFIDGQIMQADDDGNVSGHGHLLEKANDMGVGATDTKIDASAAPKSHAIHDVKSDGEGVDISTLID